MTATKHAPISTKLADSGDRETFFIFHSVWFQSKMFPKPIHFFFTWDACYLQVSDWIFSSCFADHFICQVGEGNENLSTPSSDSQLICHTHFYKYCSHLPRMHLQLAEYYIHILCKYLYICIYVHMYMHILYTHIIHIQIKVYSSTPHFSGMPKWTSTIVKLQVNWHLQ